jgi:hypothetical protein
MTKSSKAGVQDNHAPAMNWNAIAVSGAMRC